MRIEPFELERYFARYEFVSRHLLSSSECEGDSMASLLSMADDECRSLWDGLRMGYTEYGGHPLLREAVAGLYEHVDSMQVNALVPLEGIFLAMNACLEAGDHVVCMFPGYQALYEVARSIGCEVDLWTPHEESTWRFDVDDLRSLVKPATRLLVLNVPHNPTGAVIAPDAWDEIISLCREQGIRLFCDEMYRGLEHDGVEQVVSAVDLLEDAIALGGLSKTYGLPGLRLGWLVSRDVDFMQRVSRLRDYTTMCNSAPGELLGLIALRNGKTIIDRHRARLATHLDLLDAFISAHAGQLELARPEGTTICFPRLLEHSAEELARRAAMDRSLMVVPSTLFGFGDHHLRLGMGRKDFPECLEQLGQQLQGR